MDEEEFAVPKSLDGARLDAATFELFSPASRTVARKLVQEGGVLLNGRRAAKGALVREGDLLRLSNPADLRSDDSAVSSPDAPLKVLFASDAVLVCDKPAGMPTAPIKPNETGTLANALVGHYPELADIGHSLREPGLLHRLDTDTSGVVVAARTFEAFERLSAALKRAEVYKTYVIVCPALDLPEVGTIDIPIANHPKDRRRVLACSHPRDVIRYSPRPASTEYQLLRRGNGRALVSVVIHRALRHQIRAHFAAIGHPLVGDILYGGEPVAGFDRHALHAERVRYQGDADISFDVTSPVPADILALLGDEKA
jgi:23S rRNA pseudouridine1911/1915/1917 synthase